MDAHLPDLAVKVHWQNALKLLAGRVGKVKEALVSR